MGGGDSPTIVAMDRSSNKVIAIGQVFSMTRKPREHQNHSSLKDGVIADFNASEQMIICSSRVPTLNETGYPFLKMVICILWYHRSDARRSRIC